MSGTIKKIICFFAIYYMITLTAGAQSLSVQEGLQYYQEGEYYKTIDALERVISQGPAEDRAHMILISSHLEIGNFAVAEEKAKNAMERFPEIPAFKWLRAEALLNQRRFLEALKEYQNVNDAIKKGETLRPLQAGSDHVQLRLGQVRQALAAEAYQRDEPEEAIRQMKGAAGHLQDSVQVHKNLIRLYLKEEQLEQAIRAADRAKNLFPDDTDLLRMKATAHYRMENTDAVIEQFGKIYEKDPGDVENGLLYAELLIVNRRSDKGVAVLENLQKKYPKERRVYQMLADLYERRFNMEGKRAVLRQMQKQFPDDPDVIEQIAGTYEMEKNWKQARAIYDSLTVMTGDDVQYGLAKAETYRSQDSLEAAADIYEAIYRIHPENQNVLYRRGKNLENRKKWPEAARVYSDWLEVSGERQTEARVRLGVVTMKAGDEQQALQQLQRAVERGTKNPEAYLYLSRLNEQEDKLEKSFELASKALQMSLRQMARQQQSFEARIQKEGIYSQAGNEKKLREIDETNNLAKESFKWLTEGFSREMVEPVVEKLAVKYHTSGRLFFMIGTYYDSVGDDKTASEYLEKAIRFSPRLIEAHLARADLFEERGERSKAIEAYEKAGGLDAEHPDPYSALIRLYRNQGKLDQLCDRWQARYRAKPNNKVLKNHLVEALHKANRFEEAREVLEKD